jgi:pimeloyl-ACP methyl ester carboxylesterase
MAPYATGVIDAPAGFVVTVEPGDRIHFLDWGGPGGTRRPGVLLIHGLGQTTWTWTPVARRLVAAGLRVVAIDLRGHGLSDAPTEDGAYRADAFAEDVVAVAEGSGLIVEGPDRLVLVGHGFGAMVAGWGAARLGARCAGVVLVDGGWESMEASTGLDVDEFLRGLDEPPEVLRSMTAFLRDRKGWDPSTWDADQEHAARSTVVETHAGRVVPTTRPHVTEAVVRTMFGYDPVAALTRVARPVLAIEAGADEARLGAIGVVDAERAVAGLPPLRHVRLPAIGHNLMRYRPDDVTREILALTTTP